MIWDWSRRTRVGGGVLPRARITETFRRLNRGGCSVPDVPPNPFSVAKAPVDPKVTPQATAEGTGARCASGRCLLLLEVASGIERQQELLPALVPDKHIVTFQEFRNRLCRSRSMVAFHGVTIQIRVLDDKVAARRDERGVSVQFRQDVVFTMPGVEDDQDGGLASSAPTDLAQNRVRGRGTGEIGNPSMPRSAALARRVDCQDLAPA